MNSLPKKTLIRMAHHRLHAFYTIFKPSCVLVNPERITKDSVLEIIQGYDPEIRTQQVMKELKFFLKRPDVTDEIVKSAQSIWIVEAIMER